MNKTKLVQTVGTIVALVGFFLLIHGIINDAQTAGAIGIVIFLVGFVPAAGSALYRWLKS